MLIALAAGALLAQTQIQQGIELPEPGGKPSRLMLSVADQRLDPPKISPLNSWEFDWLVKGFVQLEPINPSLSLRLRVFSQEHKTFDDRAPMVARMTMRLWEFNHDALRIDHAMAYGGGSVDIYLCFGGKSGGEQLFGEDFESGRRRKANTIYIYDLASFTSPVEMAREVAHEYGHATLAPVGGYASPEAWANGYLGEKLFLRYLRDQLAAKRLSPDDAMGADAASLDKWVRSNVDPLVLQASSRNPFVNLKGKGPASMNAFLGLALYQSAILPPEVFARSLLAIGSTSAFDYPGAVLNACALQRTVDLTIPPLLSARPLWIPLGRAKISAATVLARDGGWAKVLPKSSRLQLSDFK